MHYRTLDYVSAFEIARPAKSYCRTSGSASEQRMPYSNETADVLKPLIRDAIEPR